MIFLLFSYYLAAISDFKEFVLLQKLRKLEPIEISSDSLGFASDSGNLGAFRVYFGGFTIEISSKCTQNTPKLHQI